MNKQDLPTLAQLVIHARQSDAQLSVNSTILYSIFMNFVLTAPVQTKREVLDNILTFTRMTVHARTGTESDASSFESEFKARLKVFIDMLENSLK